MVWTGLWWFRRRTSGWRVWTDNNFSLIEHLETSQEGIASVEYFEVDKYIYNAILVSLISKFVTRVKEKYRNFADVTKQWWKRLMACFYGNGRVNVRSWDVTYFLLPPPYFKPSIITTCYSHAIGFKITDVDISPIIGSSTLQPLAKCLAPSKESRYCTRIWPSRGYRAQLYVTTD